LQEKNTKKQSMGAEPGNWDKKDLVRRVCHALDIAKQVVQRLAANGYTDPDEPANCVRPEKVIAETALLLFAVSLSEQTHEVNERMQCVARLLVPHARSERMLLGLCLEPALAWEYAQAHVCLARLGFEDPDVDELVRQCASSQAKAGRERAPHRLLEQEWVIDTWKQSRTSARSPAPDVALNSLLNHPMDLIGGSREDVYAFTHALMYASNFNVYHRQLPRPRAVILAEAETALARCLDEQDYDLGGEVLLAWPLTGKSWSAAAAFGFRVLARVEDEAGFLPAPTTRLNRLNKMQGNERANYLLATAYHTAYVMGLLCAAALQPRRAPPSKIPRSGAAHGSAKLILRFIDADGRSAHWRDELSQLTRPERDATAGLLLNIALRRKISRREFGAVHELLKVGYSLGLSDTPASSQAAEMLERLATFANIKRARGETGGKMN
jgi:hypothetical protein